MDAVQCKNRYKIATKSAQSGLLTGRDVAAITRFQVNASCLEKWDNEPLNSLALSLMVQAQITFN